MRFLKWAALAMTGAGAYALVEPYLFQVETLPVPLWEGGPRLDVLHLGDTHLTARDRRLLRFLEELPSVLGAPPDLIVATGDMIDDDSGIDPLLNALEGLEARHGKFFVLGSHDYYQARFKPPTKYLSRPTVPVPAPKADVARLTRGLQAQGWTSVINSNAHAEVPGGRIRIAGVDDPYLKRHRTGHIERSRDELLAIGLVHAPDVVSEWALQGFDLIVAGHTHGGQLRVPGFGALVTNSSLPRALASGSTRIGESRLHVTRGLGQSRFTPVRFACRPHVTLLQLRGGSAQ